MVSAEVEAKVLAWFNWVTRAEQITAKIHDDPGFGSSSPRAYGVRRKLAQRILDARSRLAGKRFTALAQLDAIYRMGPDTLHDVVWSLSTEVGAIPAIAAQRFRDAKRVLVVCGSGVSAESNLPTHGNEAWAVQAADPGSDEPSWNVDQELSDDQKGLFPGAPPAWRSGLTADQLRVLSTPRAFGADLELVWEWVLYRRDRAAAASSNTAHVELGKMALHYDRAEREILIITQNQDGLLLRELSAVGRADLLLELHGSLFRARCLRCDDRFETPAELPDRDEDDERPRYFVCPRPSCGGIARPDVLWFTERYSPSLADAGAHAAQSDAVLVIGTSGSVRPPSWLALEARFRNGAYVLEMDSGADSAITEYVDHRVDTTAAGGMIGLRDAVGWS